MPLNPLRFEKYCGHLPEVSRDPTTYLHHAHCLCDCGGRQVRIKSGWFRTETRALECLEAAVLTEHGRIVMDQQNWHCAGCGRVAPLSAHHKLFRSHGRDDRVTNLVGHCITCHGKEHGTA